MHEAQLHEHNWFITLTYDDDHIPQYGSLHYPDFQKFMKRLRKVANSSVRFYMCGEYGDEFSRPHYHACLFNFEIPDLQVLKRTAKHVLYTSKLLERLWPFGFVTIGHVTPESAAYVASYCIKKIVGKNADDHYQRVYPITGEIVKLTPEFARMSLKPAIGKDWITKFTTDVFNGHGSDSVIMQGGFKMKPPRYYDKWLSMNDDDQYEWLKALRSNKEFNTLDNTPDRLIAQEQVLQSKLSHKRRSL
jgi:hypothetical protein